MLPRARRVTRGRSGLNAPRQPCLVVKLPPEILARILTFVVHCAFHPLEFHALSPIALRDLINVSHVNSLLRNVAISNPHLWTNFASLNFNSQAFLSTVLERSAPQPFVLSFLENDTFLPGLMWTVVERHLERLRFLCIEVAEGVEGFWVQAVLSVALPTVEQAIIKYRGYRNVCLDHTFSIARRASLPLRTLDLINCYASPPFGASNRITSFGVRYFCDLDPPHDDAIPFHRFVSWNPQLKHLRTLILYNCISPNTALSADRLELPSLEMLMVATSFRLSKLLARKMRYPIGCSMRISVLLPGVITLNDAETAGSAGTAFILPGERFCECYLELNPEAPSIRFIRDTGRTVSVTFVIERPTLAVSTFTTIALRSINLLTFYLPPLTPIGLFTFVMWDAFATALVDHTANVCCAHVIFPPNPTDSILLPPMLTVMPHIDTLSVYPPTAYASYAFEWAMQRKYNFSQLQHIFLKVDDPEMVGEVVAGLAEFLHREVRRGTPIRRVLFVVSPGVVHSMGYAGEQGVRAMLADMAEGFPASVQVEWREM